MLYLGGNFRVMEIRVHENSDDVDHHLSDKDIDHDENDEGQPKGVVSRQIFQGFVRKEDFLFIQDESTQKDDAGSQ